jgi:Aspartyl protease
MQNRDVSTASHGGQSVPKSITNAALLIAAIATAMGTRAGEPRPQIPAELVLERFSVAKAGDCLLLPVRIDGKHRAFVFDTGSTYTLLDTALCRGERIAAVRVKGTGGDIDVNLYPPPDARIGSLPLGPLAFVGGYDLKRLGQEVGYPIEGILGMDFLFSHVVHIDFDTGLLLFLKSVPKDSGESIEVACDPTSGLPFVIGEHSRGETLPFLVDTGNVLPYSGSLVSSEAKRMARAHGLRELGADSAVNLSGTSRRQLHRGELLKLGTFSVKEPLFCEARSKSALGLGFWSRFIVTFDFPKRKVYLREGNGYNRPDRQDWP